jgi:predicted TIM-barrel fold metal-dependent hydrolase
MLFIDCNVSYGLVTIEDQMMPVKEIADLDAEMKKAGVQKAIVWRKDQWSGYSPREGNDILARDLKMYDNLYGLWSIIPPHTKEIPDPEQMPELMKKNKIIGWRLFPEKHRFMPSPFVLKDWMLVSLKYKIPIFIHTGHGMGLDQIADLLESFPELTLIIADSNI